MGVEQEGQQGRKLETMTPYKSRTLLSETIKERGVMSFGEILDLLEENSMRFGPGTDL